MPLGASRAVIYKCSSAKGEEKRGISALWQCSGLHLLQHTLAALLQATSLALFFCPSLCLTCLFFSSEERIVLYSATDQECLQSVPPLELIPIFFNYIYPNLLTTKTEISSKLRQLDMQILALILKVGYSHLFIFLNGRRACYSLGTPGIPAHPVVISFQSYW